MSINWDEFELLNNWIKQQDLALVKSSLKFQQAIQDGLINPEIDGKMSLEEFENALDILRQNQELDKAVSTVDISQVPI